MEKYFDQEYFQLQEQLQEKIQDYHSFDLTKLSSQQNLIHCLLTQHKILAKKLLYNFPSDSLQSQASVTIKQLKTKLLKQTVDKNIIEQIQRQVQVLLNHTQNILGKKQEIRGKGLESMYDNVRKLQQNVKQMEKVMGGYKEIVELYKISLELPRQYRQKMQPHFRTITSFYPPSPYLSPHISLFQQLSQQSFLIQSPSLQQKQSLQQMFNGNLSRVPRFQESMKIRKAEEILRKRDDRCSCCESQQDDRGRGLQEVYLQKIRTLQNKKCQLQDLLFQCEQNLKSMRGIKKQSHFTKVLQAQIQQLRQQNLHLRQINTTVQINQTDQLKQHIKQLTNNYQKKIRNFQLDKNQAQSIFDDLKGMVERQSKVIQQIQSKNYQLKKHQQDKQGYIREMEAELSSITTQLNSMKSIFNHKNQSLNFQNSSLKEINFGLKEKLECFMRRQIDLKQRLGRIDDLQSQLEIIMQENGGLQARFRQADRRNRQFEQRYKGLKQAQMGIVIQKDKQIKLLRQQVQSLKQAQGYNFLIESIAIIKRWYYNYNNPNTYQTLGNPV